MKKITYLKPEDINLLESNVSIEVKTKLLQKQETIIKILKDSNQFHELYYHEKTGKHHFNDGIIIQSSAINLLWAQIHFISNGLDGIFFPVYYNLD